MVLRAGISKVTYRVGDWQQLSPNCSSEFISAAAATEVVSRGFEGFSELRENPSVTCELVVRDLLHSTHLHPGMIDGAIISCANRVDDDLESSIYRTLNKLGLEAATVFQLGFNACSALPLSLGLAKRMVEAETHQNVLALTFGSAKLDGRRVGPNGTTVFSDGAAACLISCRTSFMEILYEKTLISTRLGGSSRGMPGYEVGAEAMKLLAVVCRNLIAWLEVNGKEITQVVCSNSNAASFYIVADLMNVDVDLVFSANLERFGHVYGADPLISLQSAYDTGKFCTGDIVVALGWSLHSVSGCVLRCTSSASESSVANIGPVLT